eukprot:9757056-Heterocapsa_arctica.AAC.1
MSFRAAESCALPQRSIDVFPWPLRAYSPDGLGLTRFATAMALCTLIGDLRREDVTDGRTGT